jgi:hypothetical protein
MAAFERGKASAAADEAAWKAVRALIVKANRADPNDPRPLILYYRSFGEQGVAPARLAVDGLLQAFALAPQDLGLRMNAARQLLVDGKAADARRALAPIRLRSARRSARPGDLGRHRQARLERGQGRARGLGCGEQGVRRRSLRRARV